MFMDSTFSAIIITVILCLLTSGVVSLYVTYKLLSRYNDFGDSSCDLKDYSKFGITYKCSRDEVLPVEKNDFFICYGDNPYEGIERKMPEQLFKNGKK